MSATSCAALYVLFDYDEMNGNFDLVTRPDRRESEGAGASRSDILLLGIYLSVGPATARPAVREGRGVYEETMD